jgi:uncharacterized phosphosugar-binding protein
MPDGDAVLEFPVWVEVAPVSTILNVFILESLVAERLGCSGPGITPLVWTS